MGFAQGFAAGSSAYTAGRRTRIMEDQNRRAEELQPFVIDDMRMKNLTAAKTMFASSFYAGANDFLLGISNELADVNAKIKTLKGIEGGVDSPEFAELTARGQDLDAQLRDNVGIASVQLSNMLRESPGFTNHVINVLGLKDKYSPLATNSDANIDPDNPIGAIAIVENKQGKMVMVPQLRTKDGELVPMTEFRTSDGSDPIHEIPVTASLVNSLIANGMEHPTFAVMQAQGKISTDREVYASQAEKGSQTTSTPEQQPDAASSGQNDEGQLPPDSEAASGSTSTSDIPPIVKAGPAAEVDRDETTPDDTPWLERTEVQVDPKNPDYKPFTTSYISGVNTDEIARDLLEVTSGVGQFVNNLWAGVQNVGQSRAGFGVTNANAASIAKNANPPAVETVETEEQIPDTQKQVVDTMGPASQTANQTAQDPTEENITSMAMSSPNPTTPAAQQAVSDKMTQRSQAPRWNPTPRDAVYAGMMMRAGLIDGPAAMRYIQSGEFNAPQIVNIGGGRVARYSGDTGQLTGVDDFGMSAADKVSLAKANLEYKTSVLKYEREVAEMLGLTPEAAEKQRLALDTEIERSIASINPQTSEAWFDRDIIPGGKGSDEAKNWVYVSMANIQGVQPGIDYRRNPAHVRDFIKGLELASTSVIDDNWAELFVGDDDIEEIRSEAEDSGFRASRYGISTQSDYETWLVGHDKVSRYQAQISASGQERAAALDSYAGLVNLYMARDDLSYSDAAAKAADRIITGKTNDAAK